MLISAFASASSLSIFSDASDAPSMLLISDMAILPLSWTQNEYLVLPLVSTDTSQFLAHISLLWLFHKTLVCLWPSSVCLLDLSPSGRFILLHCARTEETMGNKIDVVSTLKKSQTSRNSRLSLIRALILQCSNSKLSTIFFLSSFHISYS